MLPARSGRLLLPEGHPSPKSIRVTSVEDLKGVELSYPVIVKPVDRSGSRGITKLTSPEGLQEAIERSMEQGFEKCALVEEFATGQEYSVEFISWEGKHTFLALTKKYTTGAPDFIETGHMEPAPVSDEVLEEVKAILKLYYFTDTCYRYKIIKGVCLCYQNQTM